MDKTCREINYNNVYNACKEAKCSDDYAELLTSRYLKYRARSIQNNESYYPVNYYIDYTIEWDIARGVVYYDKKAQTYKQII